MYGRNNCIYATFFFRSEWECGGVSHADRSRLIGCGQPVDLSYYPNNDVLYISDAEFGILSVGMEGGLASVLVAGEYNNTNGIDVDLLTGNIYFSSVNVTPPGSMFRLPTYSFLRYEPLTKKYRF